MLSIGKANVQYAAAFGNRRCIVFKELLSLCFSIGVEISAICVMTDLESVFDKEAFLAYKPGDFWKPARNVPKPRPGRCINDSRVLDFETVDFINRHPLLAKELGGRLVFYVAEDVFQSIAVIRVRDYTIYYAGTSEQATKM